MAQRGLQHIVRKRIITRFFFGGLVTLGITACQSIFSPPPQKTTVNTAYVQPVTRQSFGPFTSKVGFIRRPSQQLTASDKELLNCYQTPDNVQVCSAKPVSHLLRSR